jgi:hypothetical protein
MSSLSLLGSTALTPLLFFLFLLLFLNTEDQSNSVLFPSLLELNAQLNQLRSPANRIGYPVFYINLDRSTKRRELMEEQFHKHKINYTRVSATDGANCNLDSETLSNGLSYINKHKITNRETREERTFRKKLFRSFSLCFSF